MRSNVLLQLSITWQLPISVLTSNIFAQDTTPNCTSICPLGDVPDPNLNNEVLFVQDGVDITCEIYQSFAVMGGFSALECSSAFYLGVNACGCTPEEDFCQICENGSVPSDLTFESSPPFTCLDLAGFSYNEFSDSQACFANQAVDGVYCGCPNPGTSEGACRLCSNGTGLLPQPEREIEFRGSVVACSFVEYSANLNPPEQCPTFQSIGEECCVVTPSPTPPPPTASPTPRPSDNPVCHVCGEAGVVPGFPGVVINLPGIGSFNCTSLVQFGLDGFVREQNCRNVQLVAAACGCGQESPAPTASPTTSISPTMGITSNPTNLPTPDIPAQTQSPSSSPSMGPSSDASPICTSRYGGNYITMSLVMSLLLWS